MAILSKAAYPSKLPASIKAAQRLAEEDGVSLNHWIAVAEKVGAVETAAAFLRRRTTSATGAGLRRFLDNAPDVLPMAGDELLGADR